MIERKYAVTTRPASGAMNLNENKPDAKQAALTAAFTFGAILIMGLGALIIVWSSPDPYGGWSAPRIIGAFTGGMLALFSFRYAWSMGNITIALWQGYQARLLDWHNAELDMYLAQNGVETIQEISQLELTPDVASHVLVTALAIQYRLARGDTRWRHAPWSVRGLEEKQYLSGTANAVLLGELTGTRPEAMSERLAALGLVIDRKPGSAGNWAPQSFDDVFATIAKNWHRLSK